MNHEAIHSSDFRIKINNSSIVKIIYSYNNYTTFQDLLEYLVRLIPSFNICNCYEFEISNEKISKDSLICNYSKKLDKINLSNKNQSCEHSFNNFLKEPKIFLLSLIQDMQKTILDLYNKINKVNKLEKDLNLKNIEINESKNEIENLQRKFN